MPMLDLSALGGASPFGGLLNLGDGAPNFAGLNPDSGDTDKLSKLFADDPYKALDKKKAEEAAALAARSVFDQGASAVPQAGISGQQAMVPGVYGSLAPQLPQPAAPAPMAAAAPPVAPPVPMPQPRPAAPSTVDDTTIPANAQPTQGQQSAADTSAVPETSMLGRIKKFGSENSNMLMGMAAGFAGAPSLGTGMSRGFSGAAAGGQLDQKQQLFQQQQLGTRATYEALVAAGVPRQQALAGAFNPEMQKSLVQSYITDRGKKVQIIKDAMGNEHPYEVNQYPKDGEPVLKPIDLGNGAGSANPTSSPEPSYDPETKRDEGFLKTLDPTTAAAVKDIADGKMPGTGRNLQKLMPYVARYENGFDNTTYQARQSLQKSYFGGGEGGKALRSANTTIDHGIQLQKAIDDLHNYSTLPGFLNPVTGKIAEQYDKKYQDALARFNTNSELYAKELDFALTGKSTVSGQNHIREMFDPYGSPVKNKASLQQTLEMLQQRVNEHENTYNSGMNHKGTAPFDMLTRRADLEKMLGQDTGAGIKAPEAGPLKPGKYVWTPDKGLQPQ